MCGIVGYVGTNDAREVLLDGLARLEYRGYDSAGIALQNGRGIRVSKRAGRLASFTQSLGENPIHGECGIAHTRWATHGAPTDENAHPHGDCSGAISVVHNGIIENYRRLRARLIEAGHTLRSDTDSEALAHLIEDEYASLARSPGGPDPLMAVRRALAQVVGSYAVAVLFEAHPDLLIAARKESPLIIGLGQGENYVASDVPAIVARTRDVLFLQDGEFARVDRHSVEIVTSTGELVTRTPVRIDWDPEQAERGGYEHFMLKEVHEQPDAVRSALRGRMELSTAEAGLALTGLTSKAWSPATIRQYNRVYVVACGTAYHAGLVGKRLIESMTDLPVNAELASEFRYSEQRLNDRTLLVVVSQSGETADTLAALKEAKSKGADVLAVTNVVGSSIAREADYVMYTQAGPEIAVASTKAYVTQLVCLGLVAVNMGLARGSLAVERAESFLAALGRLPEKIEETIQRLEPAAKALAHEWRTARDVFYIGRGLDFAVALEGQLKLKEISYIHAEALAAGELKHGTLALIEAGVPVVALATQPSLFDKAVGNFKEVAARGGQIVALALEDSPDRESLADAADAVWYLPSTLPELAPVLSAVPLQLLAYYTAVARGCDVDKPRNLAKSVTVE